MATDMGELLVGAYLQLVHGCDIIDYNVRPREKGLAGLAEFDVIGLNFPAMTAYMCEVATHLGGLEYGKGYDHSVETVRVKHERQKEYAEHYLTEFKQVEYSFWCPRVAEGLLTAGLGSIEGLRLVINGDYTAAIRELQARASRSQKNIGNDAFRVLQILGHLRED